MRPYLSKQSEKKIYWILLGIVFVGISTAFFLDCTGWTIQLPMCMMLRLTGFYCPGCGGTRAFLSLLHGHLWTSVCFHPIVLYGTLVGGWYLISHTIEYLSHEKWAIGMRYRDIYLYIAIAILLLNWIIKNLILIIGGIRLI